LAGLFALSLKALRKDNGIMYFSALSLAGFEIILLLVLQLTAGNMYQLTGLIIAGLMTGLAVGSGINIKILKNKYFIKVLLLITLYIIMGFTTGRIMTLGNRFIVVGLLVLAGFFPAVLTGSFFRDLTPAGKSDSNTSRVYSADLAGSAVGFIAFSGLAVPLLGVTLSIFLLPVLVFTGFLFALMSNKRLFY